MADYDRYQDAGVNYPLLTGGTGSNLLDVCDPALKKILNYFEFLLNNDLGTALTDAASGFATTVTSNVAYKLPIDPLTVSGFEQLQFPLLALYRKSVKYDERTTNWERGISTWGLTYILPPLSGAQAERLVPVLHSVEQILRHGTRQHQHPLYQNGANVLADASLEYIWFRQAEFGRFEFGDTLDFHAWKAELEVAELVMPYSAGEPTLSGMTSTISDNSVQPGNPVEVATVQTEIKI